MCLDWSVLKHPDSKAFSPTFKLRREYLLFVEAVTSPSDRVSAQSSAVYAYSLNLFKSQYQGYPSSYWKMTLTKLN